MAEVPNFLRVGLDHFIGEDEGEIRLDGTPLPGILQRMSIRGRLKTDQATLLFGGEKTQPLGFQAATVFIELALPSEGGFLPGSESTCYDKLAELNAVFTEVDADINAKLHRISNAQINARGIDQVWFSELESSEAHRDVITARLVLTQKEPPDFKALRREQAAIETELDEIIVEDDDAP
ncbi:MAG: hypothetical protein FVQ81_13325 [Candidatus Glassbacteria bacterium]|nr:hypothetical protein [Candidatus Glassbacteria bacterium]